MDVNINFDDENNIYDKNDNIYDIQNDSNGSNEGSKLRRIIIVLFIISISVLSLIVYARYKATGGIKVNEYKITDSSLPNNFHGVKIVQFSDVYFGNTVDLKYLKKIVSSINSLEPDIVVFTGDFISDEVDSECLNGIVEIMNSINSSIGKYAIKGDSDNNFFYDIFNSSDFTILDNSSTSIFYKGTTPIIIGNQDVSSENFSILLLHKPDDVDFLDNHFNVILAGHSLNGQINLPFIKNLYLKEGAKKYSNGFYSVNDSKLYVSSGIGTTSFKYRFNNPPSINLYRLTKY